MNLTISTRIIGGFAITSVLLFVLGMNSINVLSGISSATTHANQISIPALDVSTKLQLSFVEMSKTGLVEYYATSDDVIAESQIKIKTQSDNFSKELSELKKIVKKDPKLNKVVPDVESTFLQFKKETLSLFDSKKKTIKLSHVIEDGFKNTEMAADDASVSILDFVDYNEFPKNSPIAKIASELDNSLIAIMSSISDLLIEESRPTIEVIIKELTYNQTSISESLSKLKSSISDTDMEGYTNMVEQIEALLSLLNASNSIQNTKLSWIDQVDKTNELLNLTAQLNESGLSALNSLSIVVEDELAHTKVQVAGEVSSGITNSWIVIVVSLILSIFIAYKTVTRVTRPLAEVNRILNIVATGDLTNKLDDSAKDEFGTVAKNCNTLIDSLRDLITGIVNRSNQLATASEETSMVVKESTIAINEQRSQVEQAATATAEMASTSESVMDRANETLNDIKHADEEAELVKEISNVNKDTIIKLAGEVDSASKVINEVNQHSVAIGGILDVIRGVAEQTNLLALNAAIEAARAGEQGRGFAVVADEVRSLASKTQESTEEIQSMIEQLQKGSKSAVTVMNNSKKQAELCVEQSEQAAVALKGITDSVHQGNDMSEQIVSAAKEQNVVSSEISQRLESIVTIAEETAGGAQQTELASQEVAKLAEELRLSVDEFKL